MTHARYHYSTDASMVFLTHNLLILCVSLGYTTLALLDFQGSSPAQEFFDMEKNIPIDIAFC